MAPKSNKLKEPPTKVNVKKTSKKSSDKKSTAKKKKVRVNSNSVRFYKDARFIKSVGFVTLVIGLYLFLAFTTYIINWFAVDSAASGLAQYKDHTETVASWTGKLGTYISNFLVYKGFGLGTYLLPLVLLSLGLKLLIKTHLFSHWRWFELLIISGAWLPVTMNMIFPAHPMNLLGGLIGHYLNLWLNSYLGAAGLILLIIAVPVIFLIIDTRLAFLSKIKMPSRKSNDDDSNDVASAVNSAPSGDLYNTVEFSVDDEDVEIISKPEEGTGNTLIIEEDVFDEVDNETNVTETESNKQTSDDDNDDVELTVEPVHEEKTITGTPEPGEHKSIDTEYDPTLDLADFKYPGLDLLENYDEKNVLVTKDELEVNKTRIVETLKQYNISIVKIKATIGPTVTLYEVVPAPGIRIAKIKNLEDDIALSLSAIGIRIIAPIPGKGTVGIEVPNQNPNIVSLKSILGSERFRNNKYDLPFGIGKTISNESYVADLAKMPHLLMAGATGQGKSVGLNAIIASLLYSKHPAELKFILVDPKKVELNLYSRIERHYLAKLPDSEEAIITDTRKVVRTLNSLSIEMDNRYELLKDAQVRNIKEYNTKFIARKLNPLHGHRYLPYLVLVIDEFADLIMTAGKEVEAPVTRLAQLARAIGIHLIIATQRPSVNIITGTIKANFPARIAFRVITKIDSRTILDTSGADQLVGRGDMLFSTGSDVIRLQCAFIDTPEVERITSFIGAQRAYPDALHLPEFKDEESEQKADYDANERDELFEDAALIIVQTQQGSTSLLQRKLKLGYNRAGRIIDQLEAAGIVGPFEGSKAREVKIASEMALEQYLKDLDSKDNRTDDEK